MTEEDPTADISYLGVKKIKLFYPIQSLFSLVAVAALSVK
jgi:hypothetical protein